MAPWAALESSAGRPRTPCVRGRVACTACSRYCWGWSQRQRRAAAICAPERGRWAVTLPPPTFPPCRYNDSIPDELGARIPAHGAAGQDALAVLIGELRRPACRAPSACLEALSLSRSPAWLLQATAGPSGRRSWRRWAPARSCRRRAARWSCTWSAPCAPAWPPPHPGALVEGHGRDGERRGGCAEGQQEGKGGGGDGGMDREGGGASLTLPPAPPAPQAASPHLLEPPPHGRPAGARRRRRRQRACRLPAHGAPQRAGVFGPRLTPLPAPALRPLVQPALRGHL